MNDQNSQAFRFQSNIPVNVAFCYDKGMLKDGKYGKFMSYKILVNSKEYYIAASAALAKLIDGHYPLKGRTLNICKATEMIEGKERTNWLVDEEQKDQKPLSPQVKKEEPLPNHRDNQLLMKGCIKTVVDAFKANEVPQEMWTQMPRVIDTLFMLETK